ncbi:helix-turn-helix domain-containing protein [Amycolatopsis sp. cmx-4-54]|uniref:helix-turn-helix domain-containing protein n=1 Tax=Amycolatopsis sp. cmx-4-54 TaxID=2790936 RepID=UPI00397D58DE
MPNDDDPATLAEAYKAGAKLEELAAKTGRSYRYVRDSVLAAGVTLRPPKILIPECPPGMVNLYEQGASIRQIGAKYGHSYCQTRRMLLHAGVTLRGRGRVPYEIGRQR